MLRERRGPERYGKAVKSRLGRYWFWVAWNGKAVKERRVQAGNDEVRTGAVRSGSHGGEGYVDVCFGEIWFGSRGTAWIGVVL